MARQQSFVAPTISDVAAARLFEEEARKMRLDPGGPWVGGYVGYEWEKLRPVLAAYEVDLHGQRVLEFGCNYGGSSIVLAFLGGDVDGIDVDAAAVALARRNAAAQYGRSDIRLEYVADSRHLPFPDAQFDFVLCNSVLEYVSSEALAGVVTELQRVVKPEGRLFITGTSSRLAVKEVHSGRWLVNYLPRWLDRLSGWAPQRGVDPFALRRLVAGGFHDEDAEDGGQRWLLARAAAHGAASASKPFHLIAAAARLLRLGPGWLTPNISVMLRRRS